jgi:hypothetical protein
MPIPRKYRNLSAEAERAIVEGRLASKGFTPRHGVFYRASDKRSVVHQHTGGWPHRMTDPIALVSPSGSIVAFFSWVGEYTDGW